MPGSTSTASSRRIPSNACGLGNRGEIRILEVGAEQIAGRLLFHCDEAQRAIVEHDPFDRQAELIPVKKIPHQHGEAASPDSEITCGPGRSPASDACGIALAIEP